MNPMIAYLRKQKPEWEEYLSLMEMMDTDSNQTDSDSDSIPEAELVENKDKAYKSKIIKLKKTQSKLVNLINSLREELEEEVEFTQDLAEALGACPECFGEDEMCDNCDGEGIPGFFVPDFVQYNRFISPANKKFNKHFRIRN